MKTLYTASHMHSCVMKALQQVWNLLPCMHHDDKLLASQPL